MAAYDDLKSWCTQIRILWVDRHPFPNAADQLRPGVLTLSEDLRWVRDLNITKDKKRCLLYFDGRHVRTLDGLNKIKKIDELTWEFRDRDGVMYRLYGWWHSEQLKISDTFIKNRSPFHSFLLNRKADMYQGDYDEAVARSVADFEGGI